jgi:hypothetical protein
MKSIVARDAWRWYLSATPITKGTRCDHWLQEAAVSTQMPAVRAHGRGTRRVELEDISKSVLGEGSSKEALTSNVA